MEKKTIAIIAVVVIAILVIAGVAIGMSSNNSDSGQKYVTYDGNGGHVSSGSTVIKEYNETVPNYAWTYDYHTFKYFTENKDGSGDKYYKGDHVSYGKTLYAQYDYNNKTQIVLSGNPATYFTIMQGSTPITENTTVTCEPTASFKIKFNAGTNVTFEQGAGLDVITVFENSVPVKTITITHKQYAGNGFFDFGLAIGEKECTLTCQYQETVTITITDAPPS